MKEKLKAGVAGCGNISGIYFQNLTRLWDWVSVAACSDIIPERAKANAEKYNVPVACSTAEMLADPGIDIILNLTTPPLHAGLNREVLEAGKHVYVEKPLALTNAEAAATLGLASKRGLRVGCAPDTFLGAGLQACRAAIDDGLIGEPVSAMAFMTCHGHEGWHPDPGFYYKPGGGPMLDMGPYYLTALVHLLGPMRFVTGMTSRAFAERTVGSGPKAGRKITVEVPTHAAGTIGFRSGAVATVVMSFDIWRSTVPRIEIHGTRGSLLVPDPNGFCGPVKVYRKDEAGWSDLPLDDFPYAENSRGAGLADMAQGILEGRPHRASGELAAHVLEAMLAFDESSKSGKRVDLASACAQPEPLRERILA